jgi:4-hydroxybenzoate polyprenyltransferase
MLSSMGVLMSLAGFVMSVAYLPLNAQTSYHFFCVAVVFGLVAAIGAYAEQKE